VKRFGVPLIVLLVLLAVAIPFALHYATMQRVVVSPDELSLPADGALHRAVEISLRRSAPIDPSAVVVEGITAEVVAESGTVAEVVIQSPVNPATLRLTVRYGNTSAAVVMHFKPDFTDRFKDGTPDFLRLHLASDRDAFRAWFTTLADTAAGLTPQRLPPEINDCATLLRWCYRNTLHAHDETWLMDMPLDTMPPLPSIVQYNYPLTPLAANLFRVRSGPYADGDVANGAFTQFANAETIWRYNTFFVTRDVHLARPGDLLFYRQLEQNSPYHSMILTGVGHNWAVYDTGPHNQGLLLKSGEVRRVALDDLLQHPDTRWRPLPENSNFLGVYRWNILREDHR
jgi:uncharacterized protein YfaT (DUF1175 family)